MSLTPFSSKDPSAHIPFPPHVSFTPNRSSPSSAPFQTRQKITSLFESLQTLTQPNAFDIKSVIWLRKVEEHLTDITRLCTDFLSNALQEQRLPTERDLQRVLTELAKIEKKLEVGGSKDAEKTSDLLKKMLERNAGIEIIKKYAVEMSVRGQQAGILDSGIMLQRSAELFAGLLQKGDAFDETMDVLRNIFKPYYYLEFVTKTPSHSPVSC